MAAKKNFGDILDQWEAGCAKPYGKKRIKAERTKQNQEPRISEAEKKAQTNRQIMDAWLRQHGVVDKDAELPETQRISGSNAEKIPVDARLDLHGMTASEAEAALEAFFAEAVYRCYRKVLIIHGKGNHSKDEPVLKGVVQKFIEQNKHAGKSGKEKAGNGGSGATWVLLK